MKRNIFAIVILAAIALVACAPAAKPVEPESVLRTDQFAYSTDSNGPTSNSGVSAPPALAFDALAPAGGEGGSAPVVRQSAPAESAANSHAANERMVIKTASLSLVVDDPAKTVEAITQMAESMEGFVVSLNTSQTTYGPQATPAEQASMTIRVPTAKLNDALAQLKGLAVEVKNENISGQDVTSEYTDLKSRLTNLEAAEKQLQSIMAEATKTEDVLAVYNQLVYVREQIEVIKGQMKYYEQSAAMSAISLNIMPNIVTQPIEVGGWHPEGAAKEAIEDTIRFLQSATDGLIYFGIARLPFLVIFGVPALLLGRWLLRRTKKNAVKPAQAGTD